MKFIGQEIIIEGFQKSIQNDTLGHAYILSGEPGIGKRTLAYYMARTILCINSAINLAPCGQCRSCKSIDTGENPYISIIKHEKKNIVIKQIRDILEDIEKRPLVGKKVYIIEEADRMTVQAQNCLLKTLEEPPSYAIIILTTALYDSLLITIRSRSVQKNLKPYNADQMTEILNLKGINPAGKEHLIAISQGNPGKALNLLDDEDFMESRDKVMKFIFEEDISSSMELNQYLSSNRNAFSTCMDIIDSVYHDILMVLYSVDGGLINPDKKVNILKYAKEHSTYEIINKISKIQEVRQCLKRNLNYQLAVDMVTLEV